MEKQIIGAIYYFSFFSYPPTEDEIYSFLKKRVQKGQFLSILTKMVKKGLLKGKKINGSKITNPKPQNSNGNRYTIGEYGISGKDQISQPKADRPLDENFKFKMFLERQKISLEKIQKVKFYVKLLSFFSQIKLIGLSGSVAMLNADEKDDVDLFLITAKNRLWSGRIIGLIVAFIIGLKRKSGLQEASNKVCLNLIFDEANLQVPGYKRSEYVAHELLQMKPLVSKNKVYERFLQANRWVFGIFPNSKHNLKLIKNFKFKSPNLIGNVIELLLKRLQLYSIKQHQTKEIVTDTQLWFHPQDFGKIINNKLKIKI